MRSLLLPLLLALPASAGQKSTGMKPGAPNLRVSFELKAGDLSGSGNFVVADGSQANYVWGGEQPHEITDSHGTGVEYKKTALIVNCVVSAAPDKDLVAAECQFELSGPGKPNPDHKLKALPILTFQHQTSFTAKPGQSLTLVDEPTRKVSVKIERL